MCHRKETERQQILRRIQAAGCPIELAVPQVDTPNDLRIFQNGEAYLYDLGTAGTALALWMGLARETPGQISIVEFGDVIAPWGPLSASWLDPPESSRPIYKLQNGFDFPRTSVLNDRLGESGLRVRSGHLLQGYVLGSTKMQIPERYIHGLLVEGQFSVFDGMGKELRGPVRFLVDRGTAIGRSVRPGTGLYAPNENAPRTGSALWAPDEQFTTKSIDTSAENSHDEGRGRRSAYTAQ
jgi:hypothetical protein